MAQYSAGEARLSIVPDASKFRSQLEADLRKLRADFTVNVLADTGQARADIDRFRDVQQRRNIDVRVGVALAEADARMAAWRARQGRDIDVRVNADIGGASRAIGALDKQLSSVLGVVGQNLKLNLSIAGLGELPAASLAIANVAGALQQLAQAGLAIPGILSGVVSSIGTLALGVSGVSDAYSAVSKAADSAGAGQVRAANTAERAQRQLNDAYKDAKQEIQDLNLAARGDQLSQQQAILNAQKARRQLQRDLAGGQIKDQLDLQSDLLDIQQADQQVAETAQRNIESQQKLNEVNAAGVEGNEKVVSAHEAVANAAAASGVATDAAAKAMAKLAPNAKDFVQTLIDLKPTFTDLRNTVQQNMFDGLSGSLKSLVASDLPSLKTGLASIGTAWNGTFKQLMASLGSDSSKGFLDRILGNTANAQTRLNAAIEPLTHAIGVLTAAGSDTLPRLADGFDRIAERFDNFITKADQSGDLARWIDQGITAVGNLGDTVLNLGKAFTAVTRAAGGDGGLLGMLDRGSQKLAEFLNSVEGQNKLKEWFEEARREIQEHIIPLLKSLPGFFEGLYNAGRMIADTVVPPLRDISTFLSDHTRLIKDVVAAFALWKGISGIASLITDLKLITSLLGEGGVKGKGGKGMIGGKGILGRLALLTGGALILDQVVNSGDDDAANPSPNVPKTAITSDQLPVGQNAPFANVPGQAGGDPSALAPVAVAAGGGGLAAGPWGAGAAAAAASGNLAASASKPTPQADQDFAIIASSIPHLQGAELKQLADMFKVTPDQLKAMSRDELRKRWDAAMRGDTSVAQAPVLPPKKKGGPTPSGKGPGPTGGWPAEIHSDEWILPAHARAAVGDQALWALTQGRSFDQGGYVDQWGNPVTPGAAPGPAPGAGPVAPNLTGGGGLGDIIGKAVSGTQGVLGNVASLAQAGMGAVQAQGAPGAAGASMPSMADRAAQIPGIAGLIGSAASSDPQSALMSWGSNTAQWVANWGVQTLGKLATDLWSSPGGGGLLGFFGLQNSILSPDNPYFRSAQQTGQFFLGQDGPFGKLLGMGGNGSDLPYAGDSNTIGSQSLTLSDGTQVDLPTYGTSVTPEGKTAGGATAGAAPAAFKPAGKGAEAWRPLVRAQLAKYGPKYGITNYQAWEDAIVRQISTESGGNPAAINNYDSNAKAGHPSQGLLQFIPATFASNNVSGGAFLDPAAQIAAIIPYVTRTYGIGSDGGPNRIGRGTNYAVGGDVKGPGGPKSDVIPAMLSNGEHVLTAEDVHAMGGQSGVYAFRNALHLAPGGAVTYPQGAVMPPPTPNVPNAVHMNPTPPAPRAVAPATVAPAAPQAPTAPTPPSTPAPATVAPQQPQQNVYQNGVPAAAPNPTTGQKGTVNHNLAAVDTLINSGAADIGQLAATAISAAAGAGAGASGIPGIGAIGAISPYVSGGIQQVGKIIDQVANVASSSLVGNVPGSMGAAGARAYGKLNVAQQNVPVTAATPGTSTTSGGDIYNFNGMDVQKVFAQLDVRKNQESQARNAKYGG